MFIKSKKIIIVVLTTVLFVVIFSLVVILDFSGYELPVQNESLGQNGACGKEGDLLGGGGGPGYAEECCPGFEPVSLSKDGSFGGLFHCTKK